MPLLHIKPGLVKQFVKELNKDGEVFKYISNVFPHLKQTLKVENMFSPDQMFATCFSHKNRKETNYNNIKENGIKMGDYFWGLVRDDSCHQRKVRKTVHLS